MFDDDGAVRRRCDADELIGWGAETSKASLLVILCWRLRRYCFLTVNVGCDRRTKRKEEEMMMSGEGRILEFDEKVVVGT